jgi:hypothetical protein
VPECPGDAGFVPACLRDADCTKGTRGRCIASEPPCPCLPGGGLANCSLACSYDTCANDSDCPTHEPCQCRLLASATGPNSCMTGSKCRVDSDCGTDGYCSLSPQPCSLPFDSCEAYFCHTPRDKCTDDVDCDSGRCNYDTVNGYWSCAQLPIRL